MKHFVSIGIPTYNRARYLSKTLKSLSNQTYKYREIIVSDNASTDDTKKIVKEFMKRDNRITYFRHKKHIPAVTNFNFALSKARYPYFMWAADDDLWDKAYIESIINKFEKDKNTALIATKFAVIDSQDNIKKNKKCSFVNYRKEEITFETYLREDFYHFKANIFYGIYKTEILKKIDGYNKLPVLAASDCLTIHEIMSQGKVSLVNKVLFYKREQFYSDTIAHKRLSMINLLLNVIKTIVAIFYKTLSNFSPSNFDYIYKNVHTYFDFNQKLINKYYKNKKASLTIFNLLSAINLFTALLPNDVSSLKRRNKIFSGKS